MDQLHTRDNILGLESIRAKIPGKLSNAVFDGFESGPQKVICSVGCEVPLWIHGMT